MAHTPSVNQFRVYDRETLPHLWRFGTRWSAWTATSVLFEGLQGRVRRTNKARTPRSSTNDCAELSGYPGGVGRRHGDELRGHCPIFHSAAPRAERHGRRRAPTLVTISERRYWALAESQQALGWALDIIRTLQELESLTDADDETLK